MARLFPIGDPGVRILSHCGIFLTGSGSPALPRPRGAAGAAGIALTAALAMACGSAEGAAPVRWSEDPDPAELGSSEGIEVPPPPFQEEGIFPCSDCHDPDIPVRTKRRQLKLAHQEIELRHDEEHRWCLDCHDAADRDRLHLAGGETLPFEESYRLCGQCHGDKYRDWRAGVHGRRSGRWDGHKTYLLCVHCHDSHAPAFRPIAPEPAPTPPRRTP